MCKTAFYINGKDQLITQATQSKIKKSNSCSIAPVVDYLMCSITRLFSSVPPVKRRKLSLQISSYSFTVQSAYKTYCKNDNKKSILSINGLRTNAPDKEVKTFGHFVTTCFTEIAHIAMSVDLGVQASP